MGFITPGVSFITSKKRKGRHNRPFNHYVYSNENRNFAIRYPNQLCLREIHRVKFLWSRIMKMINRKNIDLTQLSELRYNVEQYIRLINKVESYTKITDIFPIEKNQASSLLNLITNLECKYLMRSRHSSDGLFFESILDKNFNLIKGGSILINMYENNETAFKSHKDFVDTELIDGINEEQEITVRPVTILDIPVEILVKIFAESNNISNILLTCQYFKNFVLNHMESISRYYITSRYTHIHKLTFDHATSHIISLNTADEHHHLNSHKTKLSETKSQITDNENLSVLRLINSDFKKDINGDFSSTRYRDPDSLTVISSHAFQTPFMSYHIYKSLLIDHVIPASAWPDLQEKCKEELNNMNNKITVENEYEDLMKVDVRLNKNVFIEFWNEFPINVPYLDPNDPENIEFIKHGAYVDKLRVIIDLMVNKTRFSNDFETFLVFLISLMNKVEESIVDEDFTSCIPSSLIRKYIIFNKRQQLITGNSNEDSNVYYLTDDQIWAKITLKNPLLYILLKNVANEEIEELLSPLFIGEHIQNDRTFWLTLKSKNETELIERLISIDNIFPAPSILNALALRF